MSEILNGDYYYFDCLNAILSGRYWSPEAFKDEEDAIKTASDYEAVLYRITLKDDMEVRSRRVILYNPYDQE